MTSKERLMLAIKREKPDRLPVTIHQWQPYHLKKYMNDISDIEANKLCGLDASITFFEVEEPISKKWQVTTTMEYKENYYVKHYKINTPEGILTTSEGTNAMTTWVVDPIVKKEEDIYLLKKYQPIPKLRRDKVKKVYDQLGDDGILRTFLMGKQGGCWQDACELFGVEKLIMATFDNPTWVHEFLDILLEQKLKYIEQNLKGLSFDLIETGGGASSNTVISPSLHEEFCTPYDIKIHDALHTLNYPVVYHTCGGMMKILDLIKINHCDVSETLSPTGMGGDIGTDQDGIQLYNTLHNDLALIGGMDQLNILENGNDTAIENEVQRLFNIYGQDGGYILSTSDHFFETPVDRLKKFANEAKKYTY
ncbi:hypothetical protein SH1V18_07030 [Vallitalea longa]|uniref:Uroporphyrinogen decarboxylase (URO-D) domain-containing protein n=1 Tax=Vallitalea longa TaxID=2936439 RepID=A0A9W5Y9F2_9FIRM|nr:uroporphyrinogen decarboxylase family protein [Vallitalea longa]GKX28223.1 hypothetical protein SH1V18_07030 [Vallitalea longa]